MVPKENQTSCKPPLQAGQLLDLDEFDVEYQYRVGWNASRHAL